MKLAVVAGSCRAYKIIYFILQFLILNCIFKRVLFNFIINLVIFVVYLFTTKVVIVVI